MRFGLRRFRHRKKSPQAKIKSIRNLLQTQNIVLVGMMGAGKTAIGKRLAAKLDIPFVDADIEIEAAAGKKLPIFLQTMVKSIFVMAKNV